MMLRRKEKDNKIMKVAISFIILLMFLGSTVGFFFSPSHGGSSGGSNNQNPEPYVYKGHEFTLTQQGWQVNSALGPLITQNLPQQTLKVEVGESNLDYNSFSAAKAYFIANTDKEAQGASELIRNLGLSNVQQSCLPEDKDKEECLERTIRSCEDATISEKVFIFTEIEEGIELIEENSSKIIDEKVEFKDNCLIVEGKNLVRASDRVLFEIHGII